MRSTAKVITAYVNNTMVVTIDREWIPDQKVFTSIFRIEANPMSKQHDPEITRAAIAVMHCDTNAMDDTLNAANKYLTELFTMPSAEKAVGDEPNRSTSRSAREQGSRKIAVTLLRAKAIAESHGMKDSIVYTQIVNVIRVLEQDYEFDAAELRDAADQRGE